MATSFAPSVPTKRLAAAILSTDMAFSLNNYLSWKGMQDGTTALVVADFPSVGRGVFRSPDNKQIEFFTFDPTTIAGPITILARGLDYRGGTSDGASTAAKYNWPANSTLVELGSNPPAEAEDYVDKTTDESVAGVKTFTSYPKGPGSTPTDGAELADKTYVDTHGSGVSSYNSLIIGGTAGETLAAGNLCYFKTSDQRWWLADADTIALSTNVKLGFAQGTALAAAAVNILVEGLEQNQTGLTAGGLYYISSTAGGVVLASSSIPARARFIGWAFSTTKLLFFPDDLPDNVIAGLAGEIVTAGQWVYFKASDSKWWLTDSDAAATAVGVQIGICQIDAAANAGTLIRIAGLDRTQTGLTGGTHYYIGATAGAITSTAGTFPRFVGTALGSSRFEMGDSSNLFAVEQHGNQIYAADAGANDTYVITLIPAPTAYSDGMVVRFKANTVNTGAATVNVNALGAISILRSDGSALADGDFAANQVIEVIYRGGSFYLLSPVANSPKYSSGTTTKNAADASTTQTIAHGLGRAPRYIKIFAVFPGQATPVPQFQAETVYNGTTQSSVSVKSNSGGFIATIVTTFTLNSANADTGSTGVVTVDATNINIAWTKTGSPTGTYTLLWEAQA